MADQAKSFEDIVGGVDIDPNAEGSINADGIGSSESDNIDLGARVYKSGRPDMDQDDISIPRLRLAQGLTAEVQSGNAKPGQWVLTGYPAMDAVTVVPLLYSKGRNLRDPVTRGTVCTSKNGLVGVGKPGGTCDVCPFSQWGPPAAGSNKGTPPACKKVYGYVCWSQEHESIVVIEFQSTAEQAAKNLNAFISAKGLGNFSITLTSSAQQNAKGKFYNPSMAVNPRNVPLLEAAKGAFQLT